MQYVLIVIFACLAWTRGEPTYYDFVQWTEPILGNLASDAQDNSEDGTSLVDAIGRDSVEIEDLEFKIREKIGDQLQEEMTFLMNKLQKLVYIMTRDFADPVTEKYSESILEMKIRDPEDVATDAVDFLVRQAKHATKKLLKVLKRGEDEADQMEDYLTGETLQKMTAVIGKQVLEGAEWTSIEQSVLSKVQKILDSVLMDENDVIEHALEDDVLEGLQASIKGAIPEVGEEMELFRDWLGQQVTHSVNGARFHIEKLNNAAKKVVNRATRQTQSIVREAYNFFSKYKNELGSSWDRIEAIATRMIDTSYEI